MKTLQEKAKVLIEALPYIRKFHGKTVVIKYGGAAMTDAALKASVSEDLVLLQAIGMIPVIVHGGGPEITAAMKRQGKEATFVKGLRVTDRETMEITEMVLVGKINQEIVGFMNRHGDIAAGVSGKDGHLLQVKKRKSKEDLGFVGDIEKVNTRILKALVAEGFIPIIAPVGLGHDGQAYNCNADLVAGHVAAALEAEKLLLMTDQPGIMMDLKKPESLIPTLRLKEVPSLTKKGILDKGMLPKVEACRVALEGGVHKVHIIDGRVPHALLLEIFTDQGVGSEIVRS